MTMTRRDFVSWRWGDTGGGGFFLTPIWIYYFYLATKKRKTEYRPLISEFSRVLWDIGFRVSSAGRTIDECKRIEEDNAEFHLALLDRRFLAGTKHCLRGWIPRSSGFGKTSAAIFAGATSKTDQRQAHALREYDFSSRAKREGVAGRVARLSSHGVDATNQRREKRFAADHDRGRRAGAKSGGFYGRDSMFFALQQWAE